MAAYLRLQRLGAVAYQAYHLPESQRLVMDHNNQIFLRPVAGTAPLTLEENRKTWGTFIQCLKSELGTNKVHEICRRYRFNPFNMQRRGLPLLPEHVELFSVGASRVETTAVKRGLESQHLRTVSIQQLDEQIRAANPLPLLGWHPDPSTISGDPMRLAARFIFDPLLMDKETQLLLSDVGQLSFAAWQERFCKAVINRELFEKQIIPAPGVYGRVEYYKIYRRIATGDGLVAYALLPLGSDCTLKPLLVFRPTQGSLASEDALETYLNDIQPNIGEMGYAAAKGRLDQLMRDPKFCPPLAQIEIAGYSLGGTHAQRFLADNWRQISQATFYSDPAVESELAERFAREINGAGAAVKPLHLNIFRTEGDLVHLVGEKHLGHGVTNPSVGISLFEYDQQTNNLSLSELHGRRVLDGRYQGAHITILRTREELDPYLDNMLRGPSVVLYEQMRKMFGGLIYALLYTFRIFLRLFSSMLSIEILRSSKRIY